MDPQHDKRIADKRRFAGEKIPSMKRRSQEHDYHSKRFYMITLVVKERYALLGRLIGRADAQEGSPDKRFLTCNKQKYLFSFGFLLSN